MPCADNALMTTVGVGCEATDERSRDVVRLFARTRMGVVRAGYESPVIALGIGSSIEYNPLPDRRAPAHRMRTILVPRRRIDAAFIVIISNGESYKYR